MAKPDAMAGHDMKKDAAMAGTLTVKYAEDDRGHLLVAGSDNLGRANACSPVPHAFPHRPATAHPP